MKSTVGMVIHLKTLYHLVLLSLLISLFTPLTTVLGQETVSASDFDLLDLDGDSHQLFELRGYVVILDFMTLDCDDCGHNHQQLVTISNNYDYSQVRTLSISIDGDATQSELRDYAEGAGITWPVLVDDDGVFEDYTDGGDAPSHPLTVLVGKEGDVIARYTGEIEVTVLSEEIDHELGLDIIDLKAMFMELDRGERYLIYAFLGLIGMVPFLFFMAAVKMVLIRLGVMEAPIPPPPEDIEEIRKRKKPKHT